MFRFLLGFTVVMHATALLATESQNAVMTLHGLPPLFSSSCSGSVVKSRSLSAPMYFTARHCLWGSIESLAKETSSHFTYSNGNIMSIPDPTSIAFEYSMEGAQINETRDFVIAKIPTKINSRINILKAAEKLPEIGSKISISGFPGKGLPGLATVATLSKFNCEYQGPILHTVLNRPNENQLTLGHLAKCPYEIWVKGASGGPILNESNEFIGVLSAQFNNGPIFVENGIENDNFTYILFSALTEQDFLSVDESKNHYAESLNSEVHANPITVFSITKPDITKIDTQKFKSRDLRNRTVFQKGNFIMNFKNDLLHGVFKSFTFDENPSPLQTQIWENGHFIRNIDN